MWFPTPRNLAFGRAKRFLDHVVLGLIADRRKAASPPDDLLTLLLAAQDEESGIGRSDEQVKDEAVTLRTAGHETVGAALSGTWVLLGQHPHVGTSAHGKGAKICTAATTGASGGASQAPFRAVARPGRAGRLRRKLGPGFRLRRRGRPAGPGTIAAIFGAAEGTRGLELPGARPTEGYSPKEGK